MEKTYLEFVPRSSDISLERIGRLRRRMQQRQASICSERALLFTESFRQTEGMPYGLRKAQAFAHVLDHMSIYLEPDSILFGNQASRDFAAPIYPEYSIDWVVRELDEFEQRSGDVFRIDEQTKADIRGIAPYWHGHTHEDEVLRSTPEEIFLAEKQKVLHRGGISMSGDGHIVPDYPMILKKGLRAIQQEALLHLAFPDIDEEAKIFYQAVSISLDAALRFIKRYAVLARQQAEAEPDPVRRRQLLDMAVMASSLMEHPARTFYEGVETAYLIHLLQMIESNGHSFCYGRFDQYLIDLYRQDLADQKITPEAALELITDLFLMNSTLNKVRPYAHTRFSQGYPLYSSLMIGGYRPDGIDGTNELSYLCIEAMNLTAMAEPNFAMRYNKDTPEALLRLAAKLIRTGCGMPSMFNDDTAVRGLEALGIPHADALDYCSFGCVETGVPGKYGHRATGMTYVNWGKILELLVNNGMDPASGIQMVSVSGRKGSEVDYPAYQDVWNGWRKLLKYYSDLAVECDGICDRSLARYDYDPLASCLISDCMERGRTLKNGGCRYDVISQSNIGPAVVGNSLEVIRRLIYEEKKITWRQLKAALASDWSGTEGEQLRRLVLQQPKFGNDEDGVDEIVRAVFDSYLELLPSYHTVRTGSGPRLSCYTMSTSNITSYVPNGMDVGATPDGRRAHDPLNEGCSPVQGTDRSGPTAVIRSVAKLPNEKVAAGQLLNMRFSPGALAGKENLQKFVWFLRACQQMGIYHNQFNVIDSATLRDAKAHPENYPDLIVRVAGYCAQFISLMPEAQDAIIARTENAW